MEYKKTPPHSILRKPFFTALTILLFVNTSFSQKQLSKKEKIEDFTYLYNELKESYPYFGINKRVYNTDWLSNKPKYIEAIKKTTNDTAFFKVFSGILNDLHNDHTDAYPTIVYSYFYDAYTYGATQDSIYALYVKELEKTDAVRSKYWEEINRELFFSGENDTKDKNEEDTVGTKPPKNIEISFIDSLSTAMIHIRSFSYDYVEKDADMLKHFFTKAHSYKNLIIDIQGNDGGSTEYWIQNMIPHLVDDTISTPVVYAFKNSDRLRKFKPSYFNDTIEFKDIKRSNMPEELKDGAYVFRKDHLTIKPTKNNKKYSGKIYLLVDHDVFSSSETLAYFCKATGFATIVGEKTNGDGVGSDPLLLTLPNSGIVIRFTGEMGLNPDGSANDETKTTPDVIIKATNVQERQQKLLNYIKHNK